MDFEIKQDESTAKAVNEEQEKELDAAFEEMFKQASESNLSVLQRDHSEEGFHFSVNPVSRCIEFRNSERVILCYYKWEDIYCALASFCEGAYYKFKDSEN